LLAVNPISAALSSLNPEREGGLPIGAEPDPHGDFEALFESILAQAPGPRGIDQLDSSSDPEGVLAEVEIALMTPGGEQRLPSTRQILPQEIEIEKEKDQLLVSIFIAPPAPPVPAPVVASTSTAPVSAPAASVSPLITSPAPPVPVPVVVPNLLMSAGTVELPVAYVAAELPAANVAAELPLAAVASTLATAGSTSVSPVSAPAASVSPLITSPAPPVPVPAVVPNLLMSAGTVELPVANAAAELSAAALATGLPVAALANGAVEPPLTSARLFTTPAIPVSTSASPVSAPAASISALITLPASPVMTSNPQQPPSPESSLSFPIVLPLTEQIGAESEPPRPVIVRESTPLVFSTVMNSPMSNPSPETLGSSPSPRETLVVPAHQAQLNTGEINVELIRLAKDGGGQFTIEFTPPDQGRFRVDLRIDAATGKAVLVVDGGTEATRLRLEQGAPELRQQFESLGLSLQLTLRQDQQEFERHHSHSASALPQAQGQIVKNDSDVLAELVRNSPQIGPGGISIYA
jgi:hypothetical protein